MTSYAYDDGEATYANAYLWPALKTVIEQRQWPEPRRAFDLGCGNGATCKMLTGMGFETIGVDTSESGICQAKLNGNTAHIGSAYDDLAGLYGQFSLVVSLEVVEHVMEPRAFAKTLMSLLAPGGIGFISTPYHSYLKNLALAASGRMDKHFTALWDGGHIKFFSVATLRTLLHEAGATDIEFLRVGRIPILAKSMVAVVKKN